MPPSLSGQTVLVVGLAREGTVAARWLAQHGARVIASDVRAAALESARDLAQWGVKIQLGPQTPDLLLGVDVVVASPGVPQDAPIFLAARALGIPITTETRLFAQNYLAPLVGITGSSGKTTTTTLTAKMIEASGLRTWLGGNIGEPLLGRTEEIGPDDRVVLELSSFQLLYWASDQNSASSPAGLPWSERRGISPGVAGVLNITPNHLDRHPSMAHYAAAKAHILAYQQPGDVAVLNREDAVVGAWAAAGRVSIAAGEGQAPVAFPLAAHLLTFGLHTLPSGEGAWVSEEGRIWLRWQGEAQPILHRQDLKLRGEHNLANVMAACCLAAAAGATPAAMREIASAFTGVAHRLEVVRNRNGVLWINDSIATSPERASAALHSFDEPIILLAGGRDKHLPWDSWAAAVHQRARQVITFGEAADLIAAALVPTPPDSRLEEVRAGRDLTTAVALARDLARPGDVVLLSPGGTSFDAYVDFAARGQHFRDLVNDL